MARKKKMKERKRQIIPLIGFEKGDERNDELIKVRLVGGQFRKFFQV